jgi:hypothetical protein
VYGVKRRWRRGLWEVEFVVGGRFLGRNKKLRKNERKNGENSIDLFKKG